MFLAVVMILSCFTSAFAASAVNESANVKDLIDAFGGDMTAAEPKEEDLSAYNNMVNAFNALSQDEKLCLYFGKLKSGKHYAGLYFAKIHESLRRQGAFSRKVQRLHIHLSALSV